MKKKRILVSLLGSLLLAAVATGQAWAAQSAELVGTDECLNCHEEMQKPYTRNIHSKASKWESDFEGCESCHGPGSLHAESDGETPIGSPATLEGREGDDVCLACHEGARSHQYWWGSAHEANDVTCVSCHNIHENFTKLLAKRTEAATCFECHPEQRSYLYKRATHPLTDSRHRKSSGTSTGKMTCSSCHNAHGTQSESLIAANSVNDKCYECHREMQAPVLWEHSPVKENCLNCHNAHGSNHEKMLVQKRPRLCQKCHQAGRHQTVSGEVNTFMVVNRGCSNCHAQVHGSNSPAGPKLKR